jgi:hypothetical protein
VQQAGSLIRNAREVSLHARIGALLRIAEDQAGVRSMTTHEAEEHFRAAGARARAHRLYVLVASLASDAPARVRRATTLS